MRHPEIPRRVWGDQGESIRQVLCSECVACEIQPSTDVIPTRKTFGNREMGGARANCAWIRSRAALSVPTPKRTL